MKMKRKIILFSCLIISLLLVFAFSTTTSAATIVKSGSCGDNVTYTLDSDGLLTINGTGDMNNYHDNSPWRGESYENIVISDGVTSIGDYAFADSSYLTSITIPNSVTRIGYNAFECSCLTSITIPNSVTSIGGRAFYRCRLLTSITIGSGVTALDVETFWQCERITSIEVAKGNKRYHSSGNCLIETESKTLIKGSSNSVIPTDGSVTRIGYYAFWNCTGLKSITIPDSVTSIGDEAFFGCTGLKSITIPDSVTSIGDEAFFDCTGLKSITIPDSVTFIGEFAFPGGVKVIVFNPDCSIHYDGYYSECAYTVYSHSGGKVEENVPSEYFVPIHIGENFDTYKCTDVGKRFQKCKYCDETASVDDVPFLGHTVVYEKKESTCTQSGYEKWYCKDCGYNAETKTIGAKGHDKVKHNGKTANCTEDGYKEYITCSRCDYTTKQVIPALGHDFSGPSKTNDDGTISYMCVNCGEYSVATIKDITGTKRLTQDNIDVLVAPVEMTASTVIASASGGKIVDKAGKEITDKNTPLATGMKVILGETSVTISVAGDVDGSGDISVSDARLALRAAVRLDILTGADFTSADVDFSGDISVSDARLILRAAVKLDDPKKAWIK
jgi:hypothetical protein